MSAKSQFLTIGLSALAGYALRAHQERVRANLRQTEVCYDVISSPDQIQYNLPQTVANTLEGIIQRSGQVLVRRVGDILYIASRDASGALAEQLNLPLSEAQFAGDVIDADTITASTHTAGA